MNHGAFRVLTGRWAAAWVALVLSAPAWAQTPTAYTPGPADWSQQVIYFLVTDRFADGDPSNNDFGHGEYDPEDVDFYHGGDLAGLIERLDYIKATGSTAIWHTPQVKNQWVSPTYSRAGTRFSGYHGYWAQDFYAVDPHIGDLELYRRFVREAHDRGLYVIQDIVVNHMGDFYSQDGSVLVQNGVPNAPAAPFDGLDRAAELFHFNGTDQYTQGFGNLLDDLNTENPYVIRSLIDIFKFWIRETDIDGYRIDTVKYVPLAFWEQFIPEIRAYAASLGKPNFIIFGEAYDYDNVVAFRFDEADRSTAAYTGRADRPLFNSMLDFSTAGALTQVFAGTPVTGISANRPKPRGSFAALNRRFSPEIQALYTPESRGQRVTFLDNHDMTRFLHESKLNGDQARLIPALTALYTLPGVPQLYYGTEQGFLQPRKKKGRNMGTDNRQSLWESGFDTTGTLFQITARLGQIRQSEAALGRGEFVPRLTDAFDGDVWVYSRILEGTEVLVALNRGTQARDLDLSPWAPNGGLELISGQTLPARFRLPPNGARVIRRR